MARYNIFNQIHKGLRAMLCETALLLQQADFKNDAQAMQALSAMENVITSFQTHARQEMQFILPAIQKIDVELACGFSEEHAIDGSLANRLGNLVPVFYKAVSGEDRAEIGAAILKAFNGFAAYSLYHMNKEEVMLSETLWPNYHDKEILDIHRDILASSLSWGINYESRWMMTGINNDRIVRWLKDMEVAAPDLIYKEMLSLVKSTLEKTRWDIIKGSLCQCPVSS